MQPQRRNQHIGAAAVDLGGYRLTDDITRPDRYTFPAGTLLGPGEYLVVFADSLAPVAGEIHTGFGLKQEGEGVFLIDVAGVSTNHSVEFGAQLADRSIARLPGAHLPGEGWGLAVPTLGEANRAQPLGESASLTINEWFTTGSYTLDGQTYSADFVELFNAGALPVALGGLFLTDAQ